MPVLTIDFGDGYSRSLTYGDTTGMLRFTVEWDERSRLAPLIQPRTYNMVTIGSPVSIPRYLREFYVRRLLQGNDVFWFTDMSEQVQANRIVGLYQLKMNSFKMKQSVDDPNRFSGSFVFETARGWPAQT